MCNTLNTLLQISCLYVIQDVSFCKYQTFSSPRTMLVFRSLECLETDVLSTNNLITHVLDIFKGDTRFLVLSVRLWNECIIDLCQFFLIRYNLS